MEKLTGGKSTKNTLSCRYWRLKAQLTVMPKEDRDRIMPCIDIVDRRLEKNRWNLIAEEMQAQGSEKYTVSYLAST